MKFKLLITGFEPFDQDLTNPSADFLDWIKTKSFNFEIATLLLPVSFERVYPLLEKSILTFNPTHVLLTGYAKSREILTLEKIAINWVDARIPDNDQVQLVNQKIIAHAPDGLFSRLPLVEIIKSANEIGCPAKISYSAGEYVCNYIFFQMLAQTKLPVGFIHIPKESTAYPYQTHFAGIKAMIETISSNYTL